MEGGRNVQTQAVREVVREAHEAREEHGREDARPQPQRPRYRRGARQVALDRDQGGCGAPLRHRAALALRRARARGPLGGLPQALRVAEVLQRLLAQEGLRLLEEAHVSVNIFFTIFTNVFSPIAPTRMRRIRLRGCAAFGV